MAKAEKHPFERFGDISFFVIMIVSAYSAFSGVQNELILLVLGLAGAVIAAENIRRKDDVNFLIAVTALVVVTGALLLVNLPGQLGIFLSNLLVAFGVSGFIVALGLILKLGWKE